MVNQLQTADIVFLMFDISNPPSFYNLESYYQKIKINLRRETLVCVLGNKGDIQKGSFEIEFNKKIYNFVKEHEFYYAETSIFYDSNTIYKEIVFFNKQLLNLDDYKSFLTPDENQVAASTAQSDEINSNNLQGFIIYNQVNNIENNKISKVFENNTYYNAGIIVILDLVLNEVRERKNIEIKTVRNNSGSIKISSNIVNNSCTCK